METVDNVLGGIMTINKHGVVTTPGLHQPYAVWIKGETVLFTSSLGDANLKLQAENKRIRAKQ
jgi:hypothetical protein